jgi:hypothetical protein
MPPHSSLGGTTVFIVTTEPAVTTAPSPMSAPGITTACTPTVAERPIFTGFRMIEPLVIACATTAESRPMIAKSPMLISGGSTSIPPIAVLRPTRAPNSIATRGFAKTVVNGSNAPRPNSWTTVYNFQYVKWGSFIRYSPGRSGKTASIDRTRSEDSKP